MIEKSKLNFAIDSLMMIIMMALAGIGFLMKFVLIPGKERWLVYGANVELYWLGLDRHEWGTIHLWLGYSLLFLLALHIALHFKWILNTYQRTFANTALKKMAGVFFIVICLILILFAFFTTPVVDTGRDGNREGPFGYGQRHK